MNDELNESEEMLSPMSELTPFEQLVTDSQVISQATKLQILNQPNDGDHGKTCGCWGTKFARLCQYHVGYEDGFTIAWADRSKWDS